MFQRRTPSTLTHAPRLLGGGGAAVLAVLAVSGCARERAVEPPVAGNPVPVAVAAVGGDSRSLKGLQQASAQQASSPDRASPALGPPPGLNGAEVEEIPDGPGSAARLDLAEVLTQFQGELPDSAPPPRQEQPSEESRRQALRLYVSARSRLFRGDSGGAIVDLESATRLDPMSAAPWRELGEAQLQQGKRLTAMHSLQEAVRRGGREARTLWLLGRDALRAGRTKQAVSYFAAARTQDDGDPALPNLIGTDLSEALATLGYLQASAEALAEGLQVSDQAGSTRMRVELGELLRRRSDLWRDLGDRLCRLGRYAPALDAYVQAQLLPTFDPSSLVPRQIYALMKLGRPADAALLLVGQIYEAQGRADDRVLALIPYVAASGAIAHDLAGAIGELAAGYREGVSPTVADRLVRAQAAAASPDNARALLRGHVVSLPPSVTCAAALGQLLATYAPQDAGAVRELVAVIEQSPAHTLVCAGALLNSAVDLDSALVALPARSGSDAQTLLRAALLSSIGFQGDAADLVTDRKWGPHSAGAGAFLETVLNAQIGRWERARAAFERPALKGESPSVLRLRAQGAVSLQQPREAADLVGRLVVDPAHDRERIDDVLDAARLAVQGSEGARAETLFKRAVEADPYDERGYDGLVRLYLPGGPLADNEKVSETVRALRERCPSSRSLRLNAAEEMAERQLDTQAEQMLLELADEDLSDLGAGSMLIALWDRRVQAAKTTAARDLEKPRLERAETWLRERTARRPEQPWLWAGLARVLAGQGRGAEAEAMLAERLLKRPFPALAQVREAILRDSLDRADEADRLALQRLEPAPRSLESSIELADLYVRLKRSGEAAKLLGEAIPDGITLTDGQSTRLVIMLMRVSQGSSAAPADVDGAVALFDAVAARSVRLPPQLHEARIAVLTARPKLDSEGLRRAVELAARQHPALAPNFYTRVADALLKDSDPARQAGALPYLRLAVESSTSPSAELVWALVRVTVFAGDGPDLDQLLEQIKKPEQISSLLSERLSTGRPIPSEPEKLRAELAYHLGGAYASVEKHELADRAYAAALRFNPGHAWTKNDWGYLLLERGSDLDRAARLLEEAYSALPEESSVIDSLAWLRYKQGMITDQVGADGEVNRPGAVTLLERAAATENGARNATIQDHLGDALWVAGRREQAAQAWAQASALAQEQLAKLRQADRGSRAAEEAAKTLQAILRKQRSLADGREPEVAPRAGDR